MDTFFVWYCWECQRDFASNKALDQHFKDSPIHKTFECGLCGQECVGTAAFDGHMAWYHPPPYCGECNREFISEQALDQHFRDSLVHKNFECKECGQECFGAAALDEHMDAYHPPAICRQCDREFISEQALGQHFKDSLVHKIFECEECGQECFGAAALNHHMDAYHPPPICRQCDREFTSLKALMQHIQESSVHKVFDCQECGKECIGKAALDDHEDTFHSFTCQQCNRQFGSEEALQQHFKDPPVHRAFRCADCDREFVSQAALTQHLNSPVHVHRCEECGREFRTAASLQQHKTSPAHVFKCAPCNRTFVSRAALDQHLQSGAHASLPPVLPDVGGNGRSTNGVWIDSVWDDIPALSLQMYPVPRSQTASQVEAPTSEAPNPHRTAAASDSGASRAFKTRGTTSIGATSQDRLADVNGSNILTSGYATLVPLTAEADGQAKRSPEKPGPSAQVAAEGSLMEGGTCCICFDMPKTAALVPCGHRLCFECGDVIHKRRGDCPVCNRQIQLVLKLFG